MVSVTHLDSHWTQDMASEGDVFSVKLTITMTTSTIKNRDQNEFKADPDPCRRIDSLDSINDIVSIDVNFWKIKEVDHEVRVENEELLLRRNKTRNQPVQCIHEK